MGNNPPSPNKAHTEDISKEDGNLIFCEKGLLNNPHNQNQAYLKIKNRKIINRNFVLDKIREKTPIHISDLRRELGIGYSSLWEIIKSFEFVGLVYTTTQTDENNQEFKIIHIPENKIEKVKNEA